MDRLMTKSDTYGFSLIELMVAVAIVGILVSIALPSYNSYIQQTRREEAKRVLVAAAQHLENYFAVNMNYSGAVDSSDDTLLYYSADTDFTDYYTLSLSSYSATAYALQAVPNSDGAQSSDSCGTLTLDSLEQTGADDTDCW
jgi:type IV pilus assembly protein PilE